MSESATPGEDLLTHITSEAREIIDAAIAEAVNDERLRTAARVAELEERERVGRDILAAFIRTSDGYRARAGIVQINKWRAGLGLPPVDPAQQDRTRRKDS